MQSHFHGDYLQISAVILGIFQLCGISGKGHLKRTVSFYHNDDIGFIGDMTYPDSTLKTSQSFEKI